MVGVLSVEERAIPHRDMMCGSLLLKFSGDGE